MRRVKQRKRFMYGLIGIRLLIVDTPARPISSTERDRIVATVLDASRLLRKLGNDWAWSRTPPVTHEICRFAISWEQVSVTPLAPTPPKTGLLAVDIPAHELTWVGNLLTMLGVTTPLALDIEQHHEALADQTDGMLETAFFGRQPSDLVTLIVTTLPMGWFAYASRPEPVALIQWEDAQQEFKSVDRVIAHEICHVFGALDEYENASMQYTCVPTERGGALEFPNSNCIAGGTTHQECLMLANHPVLCTSTPLHLGWTDAQGDQIMDLATPPMITGMEAPFSFDPTLVQITGPGMQFATRVRFNDTEYATDASIDSAPSISAHVPPNLHGPITVDVQTVTGWVRGDPDVALVIVP
jgi:hypothetical protein